MSSLRKHSRLLLVAVVCVALGAGAGAIATAGATSTSAAKPPTGAGRSRAMHGLRRIARRAVHGDIVVRTKSGFATVTFDRGTVAAVNGRQLTITEGTAKATYKTVTLTIPATAAVRDDRHRASLSDVKAGQRVLVLAAPQRTYVIARAAKTG
jgi:hypothetical protein